MRKLFSFLAMIVFLSGCASQAPAPIEFKTYANSTKSGKIKSRDIKLTNDSISAEEIRDNKKKDKEDDNTFVTIRQVEEDEPNEDTKDEGKKKDSPILNSKDLEKEMEELESTEEYSSDIKNKEVGEVIAPSQNPHHRPIAEKLAFVPPIDGTIISKFGEIYMGKKNSGINISAPVGTDVKAASDGAVIYAGEDPKFGNLIVIKHNKGDLFSAYAHMNDIILKEKSLVKTGQVIGHVGKTGDVTKSQLHFAMRQGKMPVDPLIYIK